MSSTWAQRRAARATAAGGRNRDGTAGKPAGSSNLYIYIAVGVIIVLMVLLFLYVSYSNNSKSLPKVLPHMASKQNALAAAD